MIAMSQSIFKSMQKGAEKTAPFCIVKFRQGNEISENFLFACAVCPLVGRT